MDRVKDPSNILIFSSSLNSLIISLRSSFESPNNFFVIFIRTVRNASAGGGPPYHELMDVRGHVRRKSRSLEKFINPVLVCPSCHLFSLLFFLFCPFFISCYLSTDLKKTFSSFFNGNLECFIASTFLKLIETYRNLKSALHRYWRQV